MSNNPLNYQPAGTHYKDRAIQPIEYILANDLGFCEGNVLKYITRWKYKNGLADLKKAVHYLEFLIYQEESKHGEEVKESSSGSRDEEYGDGISGEQRTQLRGDGGGELGERICGHLSCGGGRCLDGAGYSDYQPDDDGEPRLDYVVFDSQNHTTI